MAEPSELEAGARIGAWQVLRSVGRGGMSEVFAVEDTRCGREAALKVLRWEAMARPHAAERFALEGRVLHELRHRGVPEVFELGHVADGRPYLVMELLQGETLAEAARRGTLSRRTALRILEQLCDVLAAAHRRGVVHRDLKPENIILQEPDPPAVKLLDWGIAKRFDEAETSLSLTTTGAIVGTPRYLSPEQARSEPVDASTDVYALALLAYELLLGIHPFEAESLGEMLMLQMVKPPPSPRRYWPDVPPGLERILLRMLAKSPGHRPPLSAVRDVIADSLLAGDGEPTTVDRMRTGDFDLAETVTDGAPGNRVTMRCRPLRR